MFNKQISYSLHKTCYSFQVIAIAPYRWYIVWCLRHQATHIQMNAGFSPTGIVSNGQSSLMMILDENFYCTNSVPPWTHNYCFKILMHVGLSPTGMEYHEHKGKDHNGLGRIFFYVNKMMWHLAKPTLAVESWCTWTLVWTPKGITTLRQQRGDQVTSRMVSIGTLQYRQRMPPCRTTICTL